MSNYYLIPYAELRRQFCKEYVSWKRMRQRCHDKNRAEWKNYGGRGITICPRWLESFVHFLTDLGPKPSLKHTLERKDNDGNYSSENCLWVLRKVQNRNKRDNQVITYQGESFCLAEWAEKLGVKRSMLWDRLNTGWSVEKAFTTPAGSERSDTVHVTYQGRTQSLWDWVKELDLPYQLVWQRIKKGWSPEKAFFQPSRNKPKSATK